MYRSICKSKLHGARVTEANIHYTGSLTLDAQLMRLANLLPYEQVHVVDVDNGARLITYCIEGAAGSGTVCINGAAARLINEGDKVIILSYAQIEESRLSRFRPIVVMLDGNNQVQRITRERCRLSLPGRIPPARQTLETARVKTNAQVKRSRLHLASNGRHRTRI
ncbi:MAG: aspartate 1-decarboxylase [Candidatus Omnitrophica bacterium]|nr:aspartate 1-decarboxylase [Candidatus Omnitrophota bacterium]MBI2174365.1 aspartate 1-decarboxylase [Candidatus Omnitrophota bacterium]MBI3010488.1 aspartate 1-decarboxylase [Candidatus Omnitrophota bacterium]